MLQNNGRRTVLIIGCTPFGAAIAQAAWKRNFSVTVVDPVESSFERLSASFNGATVIGDGTELAALEAAGTLRSDIIVAATEDDDTNIMIVQTAKNRFHKLQVFAVVNDLIKKDLCDALAIPCICPISLALRQAENMMLKTEEME